MMKISKISAYIGFSARARKIVYGVDSITKKNKQHKLIILCKTAGENTVKQINNFALKTNSTLIVLEDITIEEILKKPNCKVISIKDSNLAKAIIETYKA